MKKIKLNNLKLKSNELLERPQLSSIFGGYGSGTYNGHTIYSGPGSGGGTCCSIWDGGDELLTVCGSGSGSEAFIVNCFQAESHFNSLMGCSCF